MYYYRDGTSPNFHCRARSSSSLSILSDEPVSSRARTGSELSGYGLRRGLDFGLGSGSGFPNLSSSPSGFTSDSYINSDHCKLCLISFQNSLRALEQTEPRLYRAFGLCSTGPALLPMPVPALSLMPAN